MADGNRFCRAFAISKLDGEELIEASQKRLNQLPITYAIAGFNKSTLKRRNAGKQIARKVVLMIQKKI